MSVIQAGNTTTTSLVYRGDTTGNLVFTTGGANTVALTLSNTQAATFANTIAISGVTSGAITLAVPAVAGTNTITAPALTGNMLVSTAVSASTTNTVTNKIAINIGGTTYYLLASTSGT
jgi:hypothetical protein